MTDKELRDFQIAKRQRGMDATEFLTTLPDKYAAFGQIHDAGTMDGLGAPALHGVFVAHLERVLAEQKGRILLLLPRLYAVDDLGARLLALTWFPAEGSHEPAYTPAQAAQVLGISVEQATGRRQAALRLVTSWANEEERRESRRGAAVLAKPRGNVSQGDPRSGGLPGGRDRTAG